MSRKKVAIVNVFFPPNSIGGATRVVADNVEALQRLYADEFEVVAFTTNPDHQENYALDVYSYHGIRVYSLTTKLLPHFEWNPENQEVEKHFTKFLEFEQPDLIHFHCIQRLTGSIIKAAEKHHIPFVVTVHDAWWISDYQFLVDHLGHVFHTGHEDPLDTPRPPVGITESASLSRRMKLRTLLNKAEKILAVSESFAEIYRRNGFEDTIVCKNGVSSTVQWMPKQTGYTEKVVLGHIGGMSSHKGYDLVRQAVMDLNAENLEMVVVDHSKGPDYMQENFWGRTKVKFIGRQPQDLIVALYQSIDVILAPSIWPESYGLVTREAMACGCWVVASDIGGIGEDVDEGMNGHRVKAGSYDALFDVLKKISKEPNTYKAPSKSGGLRTSDEQVNELVQHYKL